MAAFMPTDIDRDPEWDMINKAKGEKSRAERLLICPKECNTQDVS
jgi:hypothetical protein